MTPAEGSACARAALAGNPSDGYGGAVLAVTLNEQRAQTLAGPAAALQVSPDSELVRATVDRFARHLVPAAARTAIAWSTSIPRAVGLGGSSAIVIAALRALCSLHAVTLPRATLAELALAIEVEELGIAAGLQDRVAQAYGGLTFMDFGPAAGRHCYERLDPALLPPLLVAWRPEAAGESGAVHATLRTRFEQRDPVVRSGLTEFAKLAGRARAGGASANNAGSGGAIVAACTDAGQRERVSRQLREIGCRTLAPVPI